jgi:hypothetical protein
MTPHILINFIVKNNIKLILLFCLTLLAVRCHRKSSEKPQSDEVRAQLLIDQNKEDEAISILEAKYASSNISREELKVLASAYAHKAGLKMINFINAIKTNMNFENSTRIIENSVDNLKAKKVIEQIHNMTKVLSLVNSIPVINNQQWSQLRMAINIYQSLDHKLPDEELFLSLLLITKLKYSNFTKLQSIDVLDREILENLLENLFTQISDINLALSKSLPSRHDYFAKTAKEALDLVDQVPTLIENFCVDKSEIELLLTSLNELGIHPKGINPKSVLSKEFSCDSN